MPNLIVTASHPNSPRSISTISMQNSEVTFFTNLWTTISLQTKQINLIVDVNLTVMTTNFKKAKIGQKQFDRLAIFLPAKRFSKMPNSTNLAEKRPNWQPCLAVRIEVQPRKGTGPPVTTSTADTFGPSLLSDVSRLQRLTTLWHV